MDFQNATDLDDNRLYAMFLRHTAPYRHERLVVRVRYSRGADYSGTCYYGEARIFVNLGRHNRYPYLLPTGIAKARTVPIGEGDVGGIVKPRKSGSAKARRTGNGWRREIYCLRLANAEQLALFIYLHELYHYLVKQARRSQRRKEAMCDRFATRALVDSYGCRVTYPDGQPAPRENWDIMDLDAFVAAAPRDRQMRLPLLGRIPVLIRNG